MEAITKGSYFGTRAKKLDRLELNSQTFKYNSSAIRFTVTHTPAMIQRSLLRASKPVNIRLAATSFTSLRTASPPLRPQTISPLSSRIASRWYSDAPPAKEEAKPDEPAQAEPSEAEKWKKDLEAKDKEIKDLKVRTHTTPHT